MPDLGKLEFYFFWRLVTQSFVLEMSIAGYPSAPRWPNNVCPPPPSYLSVVCMPFSLVLDDAILSQRDSLALALGLNDVMVVDVHRGAASRLYLDFVKDKLERKWALDAGDVSSLEVNNLPLLPAIFLTFVCVVSVCFEAGAAAQNGLLPKK